MVTIIKFAVLIIFLFIVGILVGIGVLMLLDRPPSTTKSVVVVSDTNSLSSQIEKYKSSNSPDGSGFVSRPSSSNNSNESIHAIGTLVSWDDGKLTLRTNYGSITLNENPAGVYELNEKTSVSVSEGDYVVGYENKSYYKNKNVTVGITKSNGTVYAKYIAVVE